MKKTIYFLMFSFLIAAFPSVMAGKSQEMSLHVENKENNPDATWSFQLAGHSCTTTGKKGKGSWDTHKRYVSPGGKGGISVYRQEGEFCSLDTSYFINFFRKNTNVGMGKVSLKKKLKCLDASKTLYIDGVLTTLYAHCTGCTGTACTYSFTSFHE